MTPPRDDRTLDIFEDWNPPDPVKRFDEFLIKTATLKSRIARAVSETLNDFCQSREEVAAHMSAYLAETVTENMLNAYASEARASHTIPFHRLLALVHVTEDVRLLQVGAELFGHSVIEDRWLDWVKVGQLADRKESIDREYEYTRRQARKGARQ